MSGELQEQGLAPGGLLTNGASDLSLYGRFRIQFPLLPVRPASLEGGSIMRFMSKTARFLRDEQAATAVEYAVMLAMILLAVVGAIGSVGAQAGGWWGGIESDLQAAGFISGS